MSDSFTLTLSGRSSLLEAWYFPPIELSPSKSYSVGLVQLLTYNSIPNIDDGRNKFYFEKDDMRVRIIIPTGNYEIEDINKYLKKELLAWKIPFNLKANDRTLTSEIETSNNIAIDFTEPDSIGQLLGFQGEILRNSTFYRASSPPDILHVNSIRIECNVTSSAYINDQRVHTIHEFFPSIPPGYKIIEVPAQVIYLPIVVQTIDHLQLKIVDQESRSVNFRGETITVRLHIKAN